MQKALFIVMWMLFFCISNVPAYKVTIRSDTPTGGDNYQKLFDFIMALPTLSPSSSGEDTVLFTDTIQKTYHLNNEFPTSSGSVRFISVATDPRNFPILYHSSGEWWEFMGSTNVAFERLVFTGTIRFATGDSTTTRQVFRNCIIRDFPQSVESFILVNGSRDQCIIFENCLVIGNKFPKGLIDNSSYGSVAPIIRVVNCTFDNNAMVFSCNNSATLVTSTVIKNCIFSSNTSVYAGSKPLKGCITYSVVPDGSFTGTDNVIAVDPLYFNSSKRAFPEDWRPTLASPARGIGDTAQSPATDISDMIRQDTDGKCDAGCWDILTGIIITHQPQSVSVFAGDSVSFKVDATGPSELTYRWYTTASDTAPVATGAILTIDSPSLSDNNSRYFCVVADSSTSITSDTVTLEVSLSDINPPKNDLSLSVVYHTVSDSIEVIVGNCTSLNRDSLKSLEIWYSIGDQEVKHTIIESSIPQSDTVIRVYHDPLFLSDQDTLMVSVIYRDLNDHYSDRVIRNIIVGQVRPPNNARLYCDSTTTTTITVHWDFEGAKEFDSIRILWGMQSFSPYTDITVPGICAKTFGPSVSIASIDSLTSDRQYHVGLQVIKESVASLITANSIVICTTKTSPLITIINSIKLYEASFIADSNVFRLAWRIDTTRSGPADSLETGIVWEVGAPPNLVDKKNRGEILVISDTKAENVLVIDMKDSLQFMAIYHFALLLRKKGSGSWTSAIDSLSCGTVETGEPSWQRVTYFEEDDSVVTAFNGTVTLQKAGEGKIFVTDTLLVFLPETIDSGFKVVSGFGIDFKNDHPSDPIVIGLAYDMARVGELPVNQIRMYQYNPTAQTWSVLNGCTIDSLEQRVYVTLRPNSYKNPFILLIDTLPPTVTIMSDTAAAVAPSLAIRDTVKITDNIVNCSAKLVYWGQLGKGGNSIILKQCTSKESTVYPVVPSDSFSIDRGIKTELVVSDGVTDMVYDISRRVNRSTSDPMSLPAMKWVPIMTTAKLSHINIEASLSALSSVKSWAYDSLYFRIFRWIDTSNTLKKRYTADISNWVEYQPDHSTLFDMVPGRVIWVKSRETKNITLGKGVTVSMKEPWEIPLKANDWNDIALPYNIDIRIGDLFTASASQGAIKDSVLIYGWERDEQTQNIVPTQTYIPAMPEYDSMRTILKFTTKEGGYATYTMRNTTSRDLVLSIPPVPAAFSPFASTSVVAAAKKHSGYEPWSIVVTARTAEGGLPPVLCAGTHLPKKRIYPVAPSFSRQRLLLRDPDQASFCGSIIQNDTGQNGFTFTLLFENRADVATQFSYTVTSVTGLPRQWNAVLHDPLTGKRDRTGNIPLSVPVGAEAGVYKMLLVGDSTYIASWNTAFTTGLSLRGIYPNPCRGPLIIRFTLPLLDIRQVDLIIYDQLGRRVRTGTFGHNVLTFGENILRWEFDGQRRLSAGTYIVQLSAQAANGANIGAIRQRFTYIY